MAETNPDLRPPVSGATRLAAVIGDPVRHSLSPALLNAAFAATGMDWTFVALEVAAGNTARAIDGLRTLGLAGLSVTMPHKGAVASLVDRCDETAEQLAAVNCVAVQDGDLVGHNTDGDGFIDGLVRDAGRDAVRGTAVVLGAGGAARAITQALGKSGAAEVLVANRTPDRAEEAALLAGSAGRAIPMAKTVDAVRSANLVVNATPVGMGVDPNPSGPTPINPDLLQVGQVVVDLVYHPLETSWLVEVRRRGVEAYGGLSMLVFQAARAFSLWTGREAPVEAMEIAARAALASRPSI